MSHHLFPEFMAVPFESLSAAPIHAFDYWPRASFLFCTYKASLGVQLFNVVNSRKIHNEINVLEGILSNRYFEHMNVLAIHKGTLMYNISHTFLERIYTTKHTHTQTHTHTHTHVC